MFEEIKALADSVERLRYTVVERGDGWCSKDDAVAVVEAVSNYDRIDPERASWPGVIRNALALYHQLRSQEASAITPRVGEALKAAREELAKDLALIVARVWFAREITAKTERAPAEEEHEAAE